MMENIIKVECLILIIKFQISLISYLNYLNNLRIIFILQIIHLQFGINIFSSFISFTLK